MKRLAQIKFKEYRPDDEQYENPGLPSITNALWVNGNYIPALAFASLGYTLSEQPQGAFSCTDATDAVRVYIGGATKLQEFVGNGFTDRSNGVYTAQAGQFWKFAEYSSPSFPALVIATDYNDTPQKINPGVDATFSNVSSAGGGTVPKASQVAVINQFIVFGNTNEAVRGQVPHRLQWCALNDPTYWAFQTLADQQKQAGEQFLSAAYGPINHVSNGPSYGVVFQERALTRMQYIGGTAVFDFVQVDMQRGCLFPNSAIQIGSLVYFIAHDGFCMTDGYTVQQIGHGTVDNTFLNNVNQSYADRVTAAWDPINKLIYWSYPSSSSSTGAPDSVLTYNYAEGKFSPITQSLTRIFPSLSFGYTMDTLDNVNTNLDLITPSLDSPYWEGGNQQIGAFDASFNYGTLTGAALTATFNTAEIDPNEGGMFYLDGIRPIFEDAGGLATVTVTPLTRTIANGAQTTGTASSPNSRTGICNNRVTARYIQAQVIFTGGGDKYLGIDIYGTSAGET